MKKTFTDEQIVGILHGFESSGKTIKEYCWKKSVSEGTFYKWRNCIWNSGGFPGQRISAIAAGKRPLEEINCRARLGN